jgi:hypothetical protein
MYFIHGYTSGTQFLTILAIGHKDRMHPEVLDSNLDTIMQGAGFYVLVTYHLIMVK